MRSAKAVGSREVAGFAIRGIDQRGLGGGGAGLLVSVKVDGATIQNNQATFFGPYNTWDMGQVEIFRGPQSTQQGRNSLAGAIVMEGADPWGALFLGRNLLDQAFLHQAWENQIGLLMGRSAEPRTFAVELTVGM